MRLPRLLTQPLLRLVDFPQYTIVGAHAPQNSVDIWLMNDGLRQSVTTNCVVAALRPLTFALANVSAQPARLSFTDRATGAVLGTIALRAERTIEVGSTALRLFTASGSAHFSLPWARFQAYSLFERWRTHRQQRTSRHNFRLTHRDLLALLAFYICPRPVVLVTVAQDQRVNMFPMDLIGPTDSPWFSLALRSTSPSVQTIRDTGRIALADIPVSYASIAYALGRHHALPHIDLATLPFTTTPTPRFGLPVTTAALRTREFEIAHVHEVGSHTLFLATVVSDSTPAAGADASGLHSALHHVSGLSLARRQVTDRVS
ncbi:MAG: flavin reductase [Vicinamibacterales bacterium]